MQCKICRQIARALSSTSGYHVPKYYDVNGNRFVRLSCWNELRENLECSTCSRIAVLFRRDLQENGYDATFEEYEFFLWDANLYQWLRLQSESQSFWPEISVRPMAEGTSENIGVVMNRDWVDLERALSWIRSCDTTHDKCHRPLVILNQKSDYRGMQLISISRSCLTEAKIGDKYIALSYVWGTAWGELRCTKANIDSLREYGSLSRKNTGQHLPETIQRAMETTLQLGFDLLWVDRLCIVQDDPVHTVAQINNMATIYSNSCLTLCAADGFDANSGLRGVPGCSQPRNMQQDIFSFSDGLVTSSWIRQIHGPSVYDERGWTFQEKILSRRVLAFTEHGLEWRCQETVAEEQHHHISRISSTYIDLNIARRDTFWPCLKKWDNLVTSYLCRKLTGEEDILRAFSGVSSALASCMSEGFLFGLPQQFFDAALLWIPTEHLRPRKDTANGFEGNEFPSWSWAGWVGSTENQINAFGLGHERSNLICDYRPRQRDIFPQAIWYKIEHEMGQGTMVEIPNDYAKYQSKGLQGTVTLAPGWSSPRSGDTYCFYHCLWIERRGSMSYRMGLARVALEVWDTLSEENVEIFLA